MFEFLFEPLTNALAHFGSGSLGKRHQQHFTDRCARLFLEQAMEAALDQRSRFTRAGACHHQDIPACCDRLLLRGIELKEPSPVLIAGFRMRTAFPHGSMRPPPGQPNWSRVSPDPSQTGDTAA